MTVTIKDVAREAQVSVATVSRALNGQDNVAEAVRHRVQGVAERLRYTPHHAARSLSSRRTRTIGVVLPDAVLISSHLGLPGLRRIGTDNHAGARAMVEHLVALGHRRIAFVSGPPGNHEAEERLRGYRDALAALLPNAAEDILPGDFREPSGEAAGRALLARPVLPDAVFAANDVMALGCLAAFNAAGVAVPGEIALAGFDDIPLARYVPPGLTTMRMDIAALGADAMRRLLAPAVDGQAEDNLRQPQLVVRASTCGARASPDSS